MATFLLLNGAEIHAAIDEQERLMLDLASGRLSRAELNVWLERHVSRPPDQAV
jgi:prophage maintenance system killer protein